jgi:hypothetical protein
MRITILGSLVWLAWSTCLPPTTALAHTDRPCPCVHPDGVAQQGEVVCLEVDGKRQLARCEMRLNNASWHFLGTSCGPTAMIDGAVDGATAGRSAAAQCTDPAWTAEVTIWLGQVPGETR